MAEAGVGTIAAGVAKAYADIVLISGHDGGTGRFTAFVGEECGRSLGTWTGGGASGPASERSAQPSNPSHRRRHEKPVSTSSSPRCWGAEEFNFGTAALIATGCVYVRKCHLNTCPVGITSQDEKFRAKYKGTPENVVLFFNAVAEEVRRYLAQIGGP